MSARLGTLLLACGALLLGAGDARAGAYTLTGQTNPSPDRITHPMGYGGVGGSITITLCIDPASSGDEPSLAIPLANIARTYNALEPVSPNIVYADFFDPNGDDTNLPFDDFDFESVGLHEIGHCLGLAHPNMASGFGANDEFAMSEAGPDASYDFDDGADNVDGSGDDQRDDDVNLVWFFKSSNNPFTVFGPGQIIDSSTFSRQLADLPGGQSYATSGGIGVSLLLGSGDTESVMNQGTTNGEEQRRLAADDVASLRFAMSGTDETQGTADDYSFTVQYIGVAPSCDIRVKMSTSTGFARCAYSFPFPLNSDHATLISGSGLAEFNPNIDWFFNDVSNEEVPLPVLPELPMLAALVLLLLGVLVLATWRRAGDPRAA